MLSKSKGSFEGWNEVWNKQSEAELLNPMYTESEPSDIFQFWQKGYALDLLNLLKGKHYQSFCELGSGRGTTTMYLAKAGYTDCTMVDLAERAFEVARYSFDKYKLPLPKMLLNDVEQTNIADASFDCIYNIGLLEHFDDPKPTLAESHRLLKPGGMIFNPIVPAQAFYKSLFHRSLFNPLSIAKILAKTAIGYRRTQTNINRTDHRGGYYEAICKELGFKNVRCIPYNPYWKVNDDGMVLTHLTLPAYKWYYRTFKKGTNLSFATSEIFGRCFLLLAEK